MVQPGRLFVGLPDHRGLVELIGWFGLVAFLFVIIVIGVSGRHRVAPSW
jgi:hypothetical protein